mgnify:CR=1 FL=1
MYRAWPGKGAEIEEDWPAEEAWPEQKSPAEGLWLGKRVSFAETLPEKKRFVEGAWLVTEEPTKEVQSREKGLLEEGAKPLKLGWETYSA